MAPRAVRPPTLLQAIAANTAFHRRQNGLTQAQLAERAGLDLRFVQRVERADHNFGVESLAALATALGVQPAELLEPRTLPSAQRGRPKAKPNPKHAGGGRAAPQNRLMPALKPRVRGSTGGFTNARPPGGARVERESPAHSSYVTVASNGHQPNAPPVTRGWPMGSTGTPSPGLRRSQPAGGCSAPPLRG